MFKIPIDPKAQEVFNGIAVDKRDLEKIFPDLKKLGEEQEKEEFEWNRTCNYLAPTRCKCGGPISQMELQCVGMCEVCEK